MVTQWDTKATANIGQPCRVDAPLGARKLDRTGERQFRCPDPRHGAARVKHAPVERGIVRRDEFRVVDPGQQGRPEFAKGGCGADVLPAEAMDPGELEPGLRRSDQERTHNLDFSVEPLREADRAGTDPPSIGGLEIDRDEGIHGTKEYHTPIRKVQFRGGDSPSLQL